MEQFSPFPSQEMWNSFRTHQGSLTLDLYISQEIQTFCVTEISWIYQIKNPGFSQTIWTTKLVMECAQIIITTTFGHSHDKTGLVHHHWLLLVGHFERQNCRPTTQQLGITGPGISIRSIGSRTGIRTQRGSISKVTRITQQGQHSSGMKEWMSTTLLKMK